LPLIHGIYPLLFSGPDCKSVLLQDRLILSEKLTYLEDLIQIL